MACAQSTASATRKQTEIWLIGQMSDSLSNTKLLSKKEVMALFYHYKTIQKQTVRDACHSAASDVLEVWEKAHIPTRLRKHVIDKIEGLFKEYDKLKKNKENKAKRSEFLKAKEESWKAGLDELFDIAHAEALDLIVIEEDRQFLLAQREAGRRGKMGNVDLTLARKEANALKKQEDHRKRVEKEKEEQRKREAQIALDSSTDSDTEVATLRSDDSKHDAANDHPSSSDTHPRKRVRRGTVNIMDDKLAVSMDMAKVSDRNAALLLTPAVQRLGHDAAKFNLNRSSIRRERIKRRQKMAENLKKEFTPTVPLIVHWDGKIMEDICSREKVDRLPIIVSGQGVDQLLNVPKLSAGTGEASAAAVYESVVAWNICQQVKGMCFDTTSVNSGIRAGACILLEQKMEKDLLWFACRHHILEIVLEAVVVHALGPSKGPDILIFKRFQSQWQSIDRSNYQTAASDAEISSSVSGVASDVIAFANAQLEQFQPRDDYQELLQLTVIFLGGTLAKDMSFKAPAGLHRARWMSKTIYSLKIWLFRQQFKLTKREQKGIADVCLFTVHLYVKAWFQAPSAICGPRIDLQFVKDIDSYKDINSTISGIAMKKFLGHLWYLSEELVALAFFDDNVPTDVKRKMVLSLQKPAGELPLKRAKVVPSNISVMQLEDFVTSNTRRFFNIAGFSASFLDKDIEAWTQDEDYKSIQESVRCMRVVNDIAERGVALMDEYNKLHTTDEEQKQFLLLIVKEYRQRYPDRNKKTLMALAK